MHCHQHPAQETYRSTVSHLLPAWSNAGNNECQQLSGRYHHGRPSPGSRTSRMLQPETPDRWLPPKKLHGMHTTSEVGDLHHNGSPNAGQRFSCLESSWTKDIQVEKVRRWAAGHVLNNYTDRSPGSVTAMLEKLEWVSVEEQRRNIPLEVLYKINNSIADISPTNCIHHSDSRTRGAERLCHEQIGHPVLSSSFFPHTVSDWNHLLLSIASACSLESFEAPHGCSLPNLQPVHATPWTPHEMYIVLTVQIKNFNQFFFFFLITCHWLGANGNHRMTDVTVGF